MSPTETETLDPRVRRTRQSIVEAFTDLLDQKGFQAVSVQDITQQAGINRATFYAHFPDKFALLQRFVEEEFHQEVEKRMLNACQYSNHNLHELIVAVCEFVGNTHERCPVSEEHFQSLVEAQVRTQVHGLLNHWLEKIPTIAGTPVSRERAATAASWAIYGLATEWSRASRQPPVAQYADEVVPLVAANLGLTIELA
ncbi:MAG TPA: TetR/AcrR family transcriptional regulator [Anaerolineales bacterium]|nr:TetR/AcrR family transcriptional regulator [Anaerolineales bacterium]